ASSGNCKTRGHIEYWVCTGTTDDPACGGYFGDSGAETEIQAADIYTGYGSHSCKWTVTKPASCTENGSEHGVCSLCGAETDRTIYRLGHLSAPAVKENETAATCEEDGSCDEVVYCDRCDEELSRKTVTLPKLGHKYDPETGLCPQCGQYDPSKFFTVQFDTDGGSAVASQPVKPTEKVTKPSDPTKDGYTFKGWFAGDTEYDFDTPVTASFTLTAKWQINTYTVTFDSNGGSAVEAQKVEYKKTATKPADPTRKGIAFLGWQLDGKDYDFAAPVTADITLVANWDIEKFTVTFDSNGGSAVPEQEVEKNEKAAEPADPTREGYTFKGWFSGDKLFSFGTKITADITLTAQWEINKYTVTFDANGGSAVAAQTVEHGRTAAAPTTTRTGYTFVEWQLGGTAYDFASPVTADITLTALWKAEEFTVTFMFNGEIHSTAKVECGKKITFPTLTAGEGRIILAWYSDAGLTNLFAEDTAVTSDITLYAAEKDTAPLMLNGEPVEGGLAGAISKASGEHTTITLYSSEDAGKLTFPKAKDAEEITIDGNGNTLRFTGPATVKPNQKLTLIDLTIKAEKKGKPQNITLTAAAGGLTLDNVTLDGKKATVTATKGDLTLGDVTASDLNVKGSAKTKLTVNGDVDATTVSGFGTVAVNGDLTVTKTLTVNELDLADGAVLNVAAGATITIKKGISGSGTLHIADGFKSISISGSVTGRIALTSDTPMTDGQLLFKSKLTDLNAHFDVSGIAPAVTDGEYSYGLYSKSGKVYLRAFKMQVGDTTYCELADIMSDITKAGKTGESYSLNLLGDVDLGKTFKLPTKGKYSALTIDGGGHTLTFSGSSVTLTGNLKLTNLTLTATAAKGCTIKQGSYTLDAGGAKLVNCTVK
ncbi:MAG: InlB B-repeat-containing protein, partial [Ruminiclostridium sp.]|nr:InlB B-repeat-containing protein [Ruminiclostridium sp.]